MCENCKLLGVENAFENRHIHNPAAVVEIIVIGMPVS